MCNCHSVSERKRLERIARVIFEKGVYNGYEKVFHNGYQKVFHNGYEKVFHNGYQKVFVFVV